MTTAPRFCVALFPSMNHALLAERILLEQAIAVKLIPVPKQLSSDCGICLRFPATLAERVRDALTGRVKLQAIRELADH